MLVGRAVLDRSAVAEERVVFSLDVEQRGVRHAGQVRGLVPPVRQLLRAAQGRLSCSESKLSNNTGKVVLFGK